MVGWRIELQELSKKASKNKLEYSEVHKMISKVLFESRKAAYLRLILTFFRLTRD